MEKYKINQMEEITNFVYTKSYNRLLERFSKLKEGKGHIIHVIAAPGTGKSTNIYKSIQELDLNVYEAKLPLPSMNMSSREVYNFMLECVRKDLQIKSSEPVGRYLEKFDAVLFADQFHDIHQIHRDKVGFSQWTNHMGLKSLKFYLICIYEYFKHRRDFKNINIILQTAWRIHLGGEKKDLFTDVGCLSALAVNILRVPFEVVKISYSEEETISIVKSHISDVNSDEIKHYIKKYGNRPRFICQNIKKDLKMD
ncbi:MAG: hypothetical protein HVN35_06515 [Methanobacteriaceae archaeon]|nr:hypothetical protein [Methanobacteriaceae archaeon]